VARVELTGLKHILAELKSFTDEQMTTTAKHMGLKTLMTEQKTTTAEFTGLITTTADQTGLEATTMENKPTKVEQKGL